MAGTFTAKVIIEIIASKEDVWKGLTDPSIVKQYFFGTEVESTYNIDSPIFFRGEWEGKRYEDKGTILDMKPNEVLKFNYWSSMSGTEDIPENYATITEELEQKGNTTYLTITQDGIDSEEKKQHSSDNWKMIMNGLKKLLEKK